MLTDRQQLQAFRRGDRAALTEVYREHLPAIARLARMGFAFRSGGQPCRFKGFEQDFEQNELIQETFVRAFSDKARQAYNGLTPYEGYLVGIAKNIVIDLFRSRTSKLKVFEGELTPAEPSAENQQDMEGALDRHRLLSFVSGFVAELPAQERRIVELRYKEGLPQEQVAKKVKVGRTTVRTLDRRIRQKLYQALLSQGLLEKTSSSAVLSQMVLVL